MATAYERVRIARGAKRPTGIDYLQNVFHGFLSCTATAATRTTQPSSAAWPTSARRR